jgi:hypothetical protein
VLQAQELKVNKISEKTEEMSPAVKRMRELVSLGYVYDHLKAGVGAVGVVPVAVYKHRQSGETREVVGVSLASLPQGEKDWSALLSSKNPRESNRKVSRVRCPGKTAKKHAKEAESRRLAREAEEAAEAKMTPEQRERARQDREARLAAEAAKREAHASKKRR